MLWSIAAPSSTNISRPARPRTIMPCPRAPMFGLDRTSKRRLLTGWWNALPRRRRRFFRTTDSSHYHRHERRRLQRQLFPAILAQRFQRREADLVVHLVAAAHPITQIDVRQVLRLRGAHMI